MQKGAWLDASVELEARISPPFTNGLQFTIRSGRRMSAHSLVDRYAVHYALALGLGQFALLRRVVNLFARRSRLGLRQGDDEDQSFDA